MDAPLNANTLSFQDNPKSSTQPSLSSDRPFFEVLRSVDFENCRASTRRQIPSNAAKVSPHLSSSKRTRNVKLRRALERTEPTKHISRQSYEGDSSVKQQASKKAPDQHALTPLPCVPLARFSVDVPAAKSQIFHLPCMPVIIDYYLRRLAIALPELDGPDEKGLLLKVWFPFVLHSPTVFQITMLFSATHFANYFPNNLNSETLLYLQQCALTGLVKLVSTGSTSDETVAAVVKMASFEALFGSSHNYHIHMQALQRILRIRGGISKLEMNGFLARLLIFIDINSAYILNTNIHLDGSMLPRQEPLKCLNAARFTGDC